jgi:uncharacterized membrane protein
MPGPMLRKLSLGEILDVSFGLYRTLFLPLLVVTLVTRALPLALSVYIQSAGGLFANVPLYLASAIMSAVLGAIAAGASTFIISENYMGHQLSAGEAFGRAAPFVGRLVLLAILTAFIFFLGCMFFLVPGIMIGTGVALGTPALVLENLPGATDAMSRSWSLTRGYRWKVFGALAVVILLLSIPFIAVGSFAAASLPTSPSAGDMVGFFGATAIAAVLQTLIYPLFYAVLVVAYYDLRVRKEAFDLELLSAGLAKA